MKVYFAASIRGGRDHANKYQDIVQHLQKHHDVLSEHVADNDLDEHGSTGDPSKIHAQDTSWIDEADTVIADVTQPSLGVGYEIRYAEEHNTPTLCIYHESSNHSPSAMIQGSPATVKAYNDIDEAKENVDAFLKRV